MKTYYAPILAAVLMSVVALAKPAMAEDGYVHVPATLEEVRDERFREALTAYSPNYDTLARGSQIFDYRLVYMDQNGFAPTLAPYDDEHVVTSMPEPVVLEPIFERQVETVTMPEPIAAVSATTTTTYPTTTAAYYTPQPQYEYRNGRWFRRR